MSHDGFPSLRHIPAWQKRDAKTKKKKDVRSATVLPRGELQIGHFPGVGLVVVDAAGGEERRWGRKVM